MVNQAMFPVCKLRLNHLYTSRTSENSFNDPFLFDYLDHDIENKRVIWLYARNAFLRQLWVAQSSKSEKTLFGISKLNDIWLCNRSSVNVQFSFSKSCTSVLPAGSGRRQSDSQNRSKLLQPRHQRCRLATFISFQFCAFHHKQTMP